MKRKLFLSSAVIPALLASSAMGQVVNFHDSSNNGPLGPGLSGGGYDELFAGQGAYSDPGNNIWNGFGFTGGYGSTYYYNASAGATGQNWPEQYGNPGNPYAAYNAGSWITSTGSNLFNSVPFGAASSLFGPSADGDATSSGQFTPITLKVGGYSGDTGNSPGNGLTNPNGAPSFLLMNCAYKNGTSPDEVFTLQNVPPGTYGLYLYGANYDNNRGTAFSVNSGSAHNGISATLNSLIGSPATTYVEGQNFVIFENVSPDAEGNITITASPNPLDGVGNENLTNETDVNGFQLIFSPPPTAVSPTVAQNVWAGDTASFSFTPAFATSPTFQWQSVIGGVTNNLTDSTTILGATTTNLTINSVAATNVGLYQCVITTATATNTSPAAPLTILTSTATSSLLAGDLTSVIGNVLAPGDVLSDFNNTVGYPFNSVPPPFNMTVKKVEDNTLYQYENFGANGSTAPYSGPVGFIVTPNAGASVVTGMRLFTAGTHPEDDPADYLLEGSEDGTNFTTITGGLLALPAQRNAAGGPINITNEVLQEIDFPNTAAYNTYRVTFTNIVDQTGTASNGVQIAEVQLLGSLAAVAPGIVQQPPPVEILLAGGTFHPTVVANGAGALTYQWYLNTSHAIATGTNATLVITNVSAADDGTYNCIVSNPYGTTNSLAVVLTVNAPSPYQQALLAYNPLGYWPLSETSGTVAFDSSANGNNGTYIGGDYNLGQPGPPMPGFGSSSLCVQLNPDSSQVSYVDVPEGPFNITSPVTIMAWVQILAANNPFEDILGHGDSSYRITMNGSGDPGFSDNGNGDATGPTSIRDGNWHMVAGVYAGGSGTTANGFLYIDGVQVAFDETTSQPGNGNDLWLGGAPDYGNGRLLVDANICHCAVITQALSASQIQQLYYAAEVAPSIVDQPPAALTIGLGGNGTITASAEGTPTLGYQWLFGTSPATANEYSGETTPTLTITDASQADAGSYYLVVSNAYGSVTSAAAVVTISDSPTIIPTLPATSYSLIGSTLILSVGEIGATPFTNAWSANGVPLVNGGRVSGATTTTLTITDIQTNDAGTYTFYTTNAYGNSSSSGTLVVFAGEPTFNTDGTGWTVNNNGVTSGQGVFTADNVIEMTDGNGGENTSFFFDVPMYVGSFNASFTYEDVGSSGVANATADGITFCIQNSAAGVNAIGTQAANGGSGVGYSIITNSAALCAELYDNGKDDAPGIAFNTNGLTPVLAGASLYGSVAPVSLISGDPIFFSLSYNGSVLAVTLTDSNADTTFSTSYDVGPMAAIVGSDTAYIGFTAATGGVSSVQTIAGFSYTPIPQLSAAVSGSTVTISWPTGIGAYTLQKSSNLSSSGDWTTVAGPYTVVGTQFQQTISSPTGSEFYRLVMVP
jgi:Immunoglobulin I-set domain/Immunoglobulin domain/Legume lectin domain